ncbi:MAG TPA: hypothetical protein PKA27_05665, partial [Fimbriimonadaceae bacterium]|nr:hypothetical protein [Fimbriimonadaceae bacterium]
TQSAKEWDYAFTDAGNLDTVTNPDSEVTKFEYLTDGRLKKITLRSTAGSNKATREFIYQDTNSSHVYQTGKNKRLRKAFDKRPFRRRRASRPKS